MRVVITGGGTGGHLSVAKAFLEEFSKQNAVCVFIGSQGGQDRAYFEDEMRFNAKHFLNTSGVVNKRGFALFKSMLYQIKAMREAFKILRKFKPNFVLSVGGYGAAPASFCAILLRIPLIIHEQNAQIGRLNKLLKPSAKIFFSSYLKSSPLRFYPVREVFFAKARVRKDIKNILFMGGSQGARVINDFALSVVETLTQKKICVFHQCGKGDFLRTLEAYIKLPLKIGILQESIDKEMIDSTLKDLKNVCIGSLESLNHCDVVLFGFSKEMPEILNKSDFALCRSGASSLWELCANGLPALFIPYPYAAGNHQYFNAKFLEDKGLGFLCLEKDLFCDVLFRTLELLQGNLEQISTDLQKECAKDATVQMCALICKELKI